MARCYSELIRIPTFVGRFEYLKLNRKEGFAEFGHRRYLNQILYACDEWKAARQKVIARDMGRDLGCIDYDINDVILVHHIDPITYEDILERHPKVFDLENLICTSKRSHKAIHYGSRDLLPQIPITRQSNDTCPWK